MYRMIYSNTESYQPQSTKPNVNDYDFGNYINPDDSQNTYKQTAQDVINKIENAYRRCIINYNGGIEPQDAFYIEYMNIIKHSTCRDAFFNFSNRGEYKRFGNDIREWAKDLRNELADKNTWDGKRWV